MRSTGIEFFNELIEYHKDSNDIKAKYARMRSLLERTTKDLTSNDTVQFSNLFGRLGFVCTKTQLDNRKTYQVHTLRINANKVLHANWAPSQADYLQDLKSLCNALCHFYRVEIPEDLLADLPAQDLIRPSVRPRGQRHARIRVEVDRWDETFVYGYDEDHPTEDPIRIRHHLEDVNTEFNPTIARLWKGAQMNLIDVVLDSSGVYTPEYFVLEPDYLIDISSLAECFKEYGNHPLNFIRGKFEPLKNTKHILLGSAANFFLDEFVNERPARPVVYLEAIKKVFKSSPFEFSTCEDFSTEQKFREFIEDTKSQFENIRNVVNNVFVQSDHRIDREEAVLEPAFICEHFGLQGRLDFLQKRPTANYSKIIELKSGKAPFGRDNAHLIGKNHRTQAFLYQLSIQTVLGIPFNVLRTYIFYSKYAEGNLRIGVPSKSQLRYTINLRNLIVAYERNIAHDRKGAVAKACIADITPETLITDEGVTENFIDNFIIPQIREFRSHFASASALESEYFYALYSFVTKEHFLSKAGDTDYEGSKGISSLWNYTLEEKMEAGEILVDLVLSQNGCDEESAVVQLTIPRYEGNFLPNFRKGDIVLLYERNSSADNVTNKQIFKGAIQSLTPQEITIRLRGRQRNRSVLPIESKYAVERDFLDSSYNAMYRGLYSFLQANKERRDLILCQREPIVDNTIRLTRDYGRPEINDVVLKAKQAKDYFILVGPPGTGKTSIALKSLVEEFYSDASKNIILLAYTNRAVDEICDALDKVAGTPAYCRIGNELSCEERHRGKLLEKLIQGCERREEVKSAIEGYRLFVGTIASISGKQELFKLKHFDVAIVDEASQILEPQIIGILSAKDASGSNAIAKFILIGDYKQLPAVVLQSQEDSTVTVNDLTAVGLVDRRNSLFERLYRRSRSVGNYTAISALTKQGRMHPEISAFPNHAFYGNKLVPVPTPHQSGDLEFVTYDRLNTIELLAATKRLSFIPSERSTTDKSNKVNLSEAKIVVSLLKTIFTLYQKNGLPFRPEESIGVITPYRSQIAMIKRELHALNNPELDKVTIDTVERFQGSQRDIILYSFSVNQYYQLDFLSNNIEEDGVLVDRKLNVAITRAKKQLFITGNPSILSNNLTYYKLIEFIRSKGAFINCNPTEFVRGAFKIEKADIDNTITENVYEPDPAFAGVFDNLVLNPIKSHPRTQYPGLIYGNDADFNRLNVIEFGRANFSGQQSLFGYTPLERVNLYCFYNMRKHYFSSYAVFKGFESVFRLSFSDTSNRITFLDFGCGPATSGLAFNQFFGTKGSVNFSYIGIDTSAAMLEKCRQFLNSGLFSRDTKYVLEESLNTVSSDYLESTFTLSNTVILNFCYLFGNLSKGDAEGLADKINTLMDKFPLNRYILVFQNSSLEKRNRSYSIFKKLLSRLRPISQDMPKTENISYRNAEMSRYDKNETVIYEILSS